MNVPYLNEIAHHRHANGWRARPFSRKNSAHRTTPVGWTDLALWRPLLACVSALAGVLAAFALHCVLTLKLIGLHYNDFGKFYYSAESGWRGLSLYAPSLATNVQVSQGIWIHLWNMNPPHFHIALWPLTWLPIGKAYVVWTLLNLAIAVVTVRAIASALGQRVTFRWVLIALFAAPTIATTATGQLTGILFGLVSWAWLDIRGERWGRAGIAVGIAWSTKVFLAPLVIYLMFRKQWRAAAIATATGAACFLIGVSVLGVGSHLEWLRALRDISWEWGPMNGSIYAPLARLGARSELMRGVVPVAHNVTQRLGYLLAVTICAVGLYAAYRDDDTDRALLAVLATCLLVSPLGWVYYAWILVGPAWACWPDRTIRRSLLVAGIGWLIPFFLLHKFDSVLFVLTIGAAYTWSFLTVWAAAVVRGRQQAPAVYWLGAIRNEPI